MTDIQAAIDSKIAKDLHGDLESLRKRGKVGEFFRLRALRGLERAVHQKAKTGPLELKMSEEEAVKRSGRRLEMFRTDGVWRWVVGEKATGAKLGSLQDAQRKELETLKSMGLVQKGVAKKGVEKLTARMFNVLVKRGGKQHHKSRGAAILVTGYEDDAETKMADMIRQQSEVVITNLFNIQSRNRRVLNRLSSFQKHNIEDIEFRKAQSHLGASEDERQWPRVEEEGEVLFVSGSGGTGEGGREMEEGSRKRIWWKRDKGTNGAEKKRSHFRRGTRESDVSTGRSRKRRPKSSGDVIVEEATRNDKRTRYARAASKSVPNFDHEEEEEDKDETLTGR